MTDTSPLSEPMPVELAATWQALVDDLKPTLDAAFDATIGAGGELRRSEHHALSGLATVGGLVMLQLTARLMMLRGVDPETALRIADGEMRIRATHELIALIVRRTQD